MARTTKTIETADVLADEAVTPEVADDEFDETLLSTAPDDWEFDTVIEESPTRVIFEEPGDTFIGLYKGIMHITPDNGKDDPFDLHTFRGRDGGLYAINDSYKLSGQLAPYVERWMKLTYMKDIESGKGNPMKDLKVDVRRD